MENSLDHDPESLPVFCDEAGFTGPDLLNPDQRVFSFASVLLDDSEAWSILDCAKKQYPVQMPEFKSAKLLKTSNGRKIILHILEAIDSRYSFVLQDKLLVLCGKVFEYIYEPVFQTDPSLLYRKNLHRFLAMYCYIFFNGDDGTDKSQDAIRQFEKFMRTLDPLEAPLLFGDAALADRPEDDPFGIILKFALGYRDLIVADNKRMEFETNDKGKWSLDVSIAGLWSMLNHWGTKGKKLRVVCDDSKPLRDQAWGMVGGENDPGINRAIAMGAPADKFGFELDGEIVFGDSRNHPALQIADIVAGAAKYCLLNGDDPKLSEIRRLLFNHIHEHTILPDFEYVELGTKAVDVNWLVLMELGERANNAQNPAAGLEEFYAAAEASWTPQQLG